jgi:UDP-N-acetylglucosamine acyltransferase
MAYAHIAHDCVVGDGVILANGATLGGHTRVGDYANLGGLVAVHQFVRIGAHAFIGGKSGVDRDVPPFTVTAGPRAKLYGINRKGLSRSGMPQETIDGLKKAYSIIWRKRKSMRDAIEEVRAEVAPSPELDLLLSFLCESKRGIMR